MTKLVAFGFAMFASLAWGQGLQLGTPTLGGSGCAPGTATVTINADQTQLSILYSAFQVEATGEDRAVANCTMNIPIKVPEGFMLKVFKIDYRGFISLPYRGATAELSTNHTFMNRRMRRGNHAGSKKFAGPIENDFFDTQAIRNAWDSDCGAQTEIQVNTQLLIKNRAPEQRAQLAELSLDSLDSQAGMQYQLALRRCR